MNKWLNYEELDNFDFNMLEVGESVYFEFYFGIIPVGCVLEDVLYDGHSAQSIRRINKKGKGQNKRTMMYKKYNYDYNGAYDKKHKEVYDGGYRERGLSRSDFI